METNLCREGRRDSVRIVRRKRDFYPSAAQASPVKPGLTVTVVMSEISEIVMIALSVSQCLSVSLFVISSDHFTSAHLELFIWRTVPTVVAQDFFLGLSRPPPSLSLLLVELMEEKDVLEEEGVKTLMMLEEEEAEEDVEDDEDAEVVESWSV